MSGNIQLGTMVTPSCEDVGSAGPSDLCDQDRSPNVDSTQMFTFKPDTDENRRSRSQSLEPMRFFRRTKKLFSNLTRSSTAYEAAELTPIPSGMIMYCVIVEDKLIRLYTIQIRRLPSLLREAIAKKLPTGKRMMVMNAQEAESALMAEHRKMRTWRILSSWLRIYETVDAVYFIDVSRVVEENEEPDNDEEESSATKETALLVKHDDTNSSPEEPQTSSGAAVPKVSNGHLEIVTVREIESTPAVVPDDVPEASAKQSSGLVALVRGLRLTNW